MGEGFRWRGETQENVSRYDPTTFLMLLYGQKILLVCHLLLHYCYNVTSLLCCERETQKSFLHE